MALTRKALVLPLLGGWFGLGSIGLSLLMARHTVAMPDPVDMARLSAATRSHAITHIVPANCSCTDRLLTDLLARDGSEHLVLAGRSARWEAELQQRPSWEQVPAAALEARFGVVSAPVLVVHVGAELRYAGGYFREPAAIHPRTAALVEGALVTSVDPLPVFGCAVSPELRDRVEPWRGWVRSFARWLRAFE